MPLKLVKMSLDGTKINANTPNTTLSWDHACKIQQQLQAEIDELIALAEQADPEEILDEMDIPAELSRRLDRLVAIAQAKAKIEGRAAQRYAEEQKEYEEKLAKRTLKTNNWVILHKGT